LTDNICHSGGAIGADKAWGDAAEHHGHKVIDFTYVGGKGSKHNPRRCVLKDEELLEADPWLVKANMRLNRTFPSESHDTNQLLRRNFFQVKTSNAVYAVAGIDGSSVYGGTAWAIEMFKLLNPESTNIFVFDESKKAWFQWNLLGWTEIKKPPVPTGLWTGIGSRVLDDCGINAIASAFVPDVKPEV
jgi:hypothetical protein